MQIGLGIGIPFTRSQIWSAIQSFNPAKLFEDGIQGLWLDPSDMSTMFQDSGDTTGTIPVTAVEQQVGLILDKSGRGNHAFAPTDAARPTLSARYNQYVGTETLATQNVTTVATNYKLSFSGTGSITLSGTTTGTYSAGTHTITCTAGTLTSTVSGTVTQASLVPSDQAILPYQRVNTATDYDSDPTKFPRYLRFSGSQSMQTASINFTSTNKMFVGAGVRNIGGGFFVESSTNADSQIGSFVIAAGFTSYTVQARGTSTGYYLPGGYTAPKTDVVFSVFDISKSTLAEELIPRFNGVVNQSGGAGTLGTGNFGNYPLYIGARAGSSQWFNGHLYQLVIAGKQASNTEIENTEEYVNSKTLALDWREVTDSSSFRWNSATSSPDAS